MDKKQSGVVRSMANVSGKRNASDFYQTPYSLTRKLLQREEFDKNKTILEPCCGAGAILKVLEEEGYKYYGYDLDNPEAPRHKDFFTETRNPFYIITNPPFRIAKEFILHMKEIVKEKFALLLPLNYLHGKERFDIIWTDKIFPLKKVYILTRYPMLTQEVRPDGKYKTGMMVYAWYIWEKEYTGNPQIDWIDNHEDVIGAK